ncbi:MAG: hypothetical protein CM1200mP40_09910 [Gammaproteobacteria bacterium]|nr:MAG: hypothetical protein CM1200mP40_09910 [Gammaproteobacteria bacterium]
MLVLIEFYLRTERLTQGITMKLIIKASFSLIIGLFAFPMAGFGQSDSITFHKDIEPILQRSCQNCHRGLGAVALCHW